MAVKGIDVFVGPHDRVPTFLCMLPYLLLVCSSISRTCLFTNVLKQFKKRLSNYQKDINSDKSNQHSLRRMHQMWKPFKKPASDNRYLYKTKTQ